MTDNGDVKTKKPPKQILIQNSGDGKWKIEFEGPITRADINRLFRTTKVQYAKLCRQRSIDRRKRKEAEELSAKKSVSKLTISSETQK